MNQFFLFSLAHTITVPIYKLLFENPIADIRNTDYQKTFKTYYVVGPIRRSSIGLEATTYTPIYNNTFMLVAQMHKDLTLPTVISPCLRALQLHVWHIVVYVVTRVKL
jgi:hypothetical protein